MKSRKPHYNYIILVIVFMLGIESCSVKNHSKIDNNIILEYIEIQSKDVFVSSLDSVKLNYRSDTLRRNIPLTYTEAISFINNRFIDIDTIETNPETKQFLKAMLLADFVYSSFSLQLFGDNFGLSNDASIKKNWNSYSISEKYKLGNNNSISLDCGERTKFYLYLVDSLLNLNGRDTSIPNIHTYPIIRIGLEEYILDPSEPMVFLDYNSEILSYNQLRSGVETIRFYRSKRIFGGTHFLISKSFNQSLSQFHGDLIQQIIELISKEFLRTEKKIPPCYIPIFEKEWNIHPINQSNNKYSIEVNYQRNLGTILNHMTFYNSYFGKSCN